MGIENLTLGKPSDRHVRETVPPPLAKIRSAYERVRSQAAEARRLAAAIERLERLAEYAEANAAESGTSGVRVIDLAARK